MSYLHNSIPKHDKKKTSKICMILIEDFSKTENIHLVSTKILLYREKIMESYRL